MTTTATPFRSFIAEPFELAIGQPHQFLISSASVALVAAEAATLVPFPANIALAVGAEWAYLRGLITGVGVKTRWAAALNWAAVVLVFGYGGLWSLRKLHMIPEVPEPWLAVLLTIVHIGAIGAVTICSAMLHRASIDAQAAEQRSTAAKEAERAERLQAERDALALEMERRQQELAIWEQGQEIKARLKMQSADAHIKMRRNAHPERSNAEPQICPKCSAPLDRPQWLAARRWGHCAACKE